MTDNPVDTATHAPKPDVTTGNAISGLIPRNIDEAYRFAQFLAQSGDLIPKDYQREPFKILAAMERGMELGLPPLASLSYIAVINGRAAIWGDALPALAQRHGHHLDYEITGEGDDMVATATLTRGDTGRTITRTFSVADAKRAGLWGNPKRQPWVQYPKRMLGMRARSWAMRDGAADAMVGLAVVEEAMDVEPRTRDVTPKQTGFAARVTKRDGDVDVDTGTGSATLGGPAPEADSAPEIDSTSEVDTAPEIDTEREEYVAGREAAEEEVSRGDCPYRDDPEKAALWFAGFDEAAEAAA